MSELRRDRLARRLRSAREIGLGFDAVGASAMRSSLLDFPSVPTAAQAIVGNVTHGRPRHARPSISAFSACGNALLALGELQFGNQKARCETRSIPCGGVTG